MRSQLKIKIKIGRKHLCTYPPPVTSEINTEQKKKKKKKRKKEKKEDAKEISFYGKESIQLSNLSWKKKAYAGPKNVLKGLRSS
jgi:hypothetical protein